MSQEALTVSSLDAGTNPNTLSQKDAAILMELAPYVPFPSSLVLLRR